MKTSAVRPATKPKVSDAGFGDLDVDDLLCFAIYAAGHAFNRFYKPFLAALDLTYPQYLVLTALWGADDQTVGELCDKLFLESSTVTPMLKRLEGMGLLTRVRDRDDERQVRVRLTPKGAELRKRTRAIPQCVVEASGLSVDRLRRLRADVAAVRDNLLAAHGDRREDE